MPHGAILIADGVHAEALMPSSHYSRNRTSGTPGPWKSFLVIALCLVVGVLSGGFAVLSIGSTLYGREIDALGAQYLHPLDTPSSDDLGADGEAGKSQAEQEEASSLGGDKYIDFKCPQNKLKVDIGLHKLMREAGAQTRWGMSIPLIGWVGWTMPNPTVGGFLRSLSPIMSHRFPGARGNISCHLSSTWLCNATNLLRSPPRHPTSAVNRIAQVPVHVTSCMRGQCRV
jgi:hypothetical protein